MAISDWVIVPGSNGSINHGPTLEVETAGPAAGDFSYAFNSASIVGSGAVALAYKQVGADFLLGSKISSVMTKVSPGGSGCSVFLFSGMGDGVGDGNINDDVYMLGIQNDVNDRVVLAKGTLSSGLPAGDPGTTVSGVKILAKGADSISPNTWIHLRLQTIVQIGGDVILIPEINLGTLGGVENWITIPGMDDRVVDGVTQILTGSPPLVTGRAGFAFQFSSTGRAGAVDYIEGVRQT